MAEITKEKMQAYEKVRSSGVTNMYAVEVVMQLSGLEKEECLDIMKNYNKYMKQYGIKRR